MRDQYMNEQEVAEVLDLKVTTMEKRRCIQKDHPPYIKVGATVLYPKAEFVKWLNSHMVRELAEDGSGRHTPAQRRQIRSSS